MALDAKWSPDAEKDLARLDKGQARRVVAAVERFASEGHGDVRKLVGEHGVMRLRAGDYRVRFEVVGGVLVVLRVQNRREAYR